ncbi:MAG: hypothetical protein LC792_17590, partial [Actinobacteria bacterium]|nr:hypothetical protein [Actinomycetota bacterium]
MQPRRLAVLLALVLACLPPATAQTGAKQPQIGYSPSDTHADVEQGTAVSYTFTLTLQPADGQDTVTLYPHFTRYGSGDLAPATTVAFRLLSSGGGYTPLGSFSGFGENAIRHSMVGGQYSIQATSTIQLNDPLGSHASYLTLTAI